MQAFVLHVLRPAAGGMLTHVLALVRRLDPARFRLAIAGPAGASLQRLEREGASCHPLPWGRVPGLAEGACALALRRLVATLRPAIVHAHGLRAAVAVRLALSRPETSERGPRPRRLCTVHGEGGTGGRAGRAVVRRLGAWAYPWFDELAAVSEALRRETAARSGLPPQRLRLTGGGVDLDRVRDPGRQETAREQRAFPGDGRLGGGPVLGTVARLAPEKGVDVLIAALPHLRRNHPGARLEIAGDGPQRGALARLARRLGVESRVRFLGWVSDLGAVLPGWDIAIVPSRREGLSLFALEAQAAGLPVVASDAGGLREAVLDGATGLLVPAGQPEAMARSIERLLADPGLYRRCTAAGPAHAAKYGDLALANTVQRWYEDVLAL